MKIPKKVRIDGIDYAVLKKAVVLMDNTICHGRVDFGACEIALNTTMGSEAHNCRTLWHEILHVITENAGLDFGEQEEKVMNAFAAGVLQVIQDNPKMFKER